MKKKKVIYIVISIIIFALCIGIFIYKYKKINSENVTKLTVDEYSMEENVELQDFNLRVNSFRQLYIKEEEVVYEMSLNIENRTDQSKNFELAVNELKSESIFANIMIEIGENVVSIAPKSSKDLKIKFLTNKKSYDNLKNKDDFGYYLNWKLFKDQCKDRFYNDKEYCRKVINLKLDK